MIKRASYVSLLGLCLVTVCYSQDRAFGLGLVLGEPTGITAKLWLNRKNALSFGLGWGYYHWGGRYYNDNRCYDRDFYNNNRNYCNNQGSYYGYDRDGYRRLHLHGDYLIHNFEIIKSSYSIPLYYGPGININFWDYGNLPNLGVRIVGGIAFIPPKAPLDIFLEIVPIIQLLPGVWLDVNMGLGIRYFF
ncbi:hypothetical protein ACFL5V_12825 [Fibrobacterota bacterium]